MSNGSSEVEEGIGKRHPDEIAVEKKKHQLELQRRRQTKYKEQQKLKSLTSHKTTLTVKLKTVSSKVLTRNVVQSKREYNRVMKQKQRQNMTPQKRAWEKKKDRERKAQKRFDKTKQMHSISSSNLTPFISKKNNGILQARPRKVSHRVQKSLPKS